MPPYSSQLGFTSSLLTTLRESRAQVDAFVESEKERCDQQCVQHEARVAQEQALVDSQVSSLLELELERGLSNNNDSNNNDNNKGLLKRRQELQRQQEEVKQEIASLQNTQTKRQEELKGNKM